MKEQDDLQLFENDLDGEVLTKEGLELQMQVKKQKLLNELEELQPKKEKPFLNRIVQGAMDDIHVYSEWVKNNILELERIQAKGRINKMELTNDYVDEQRDKVEDPIVESVLTMDFGETPFTDF